MVKINYNSVVVHYDEIGLKGNNRSHFENLLIDNIKIKLGSLLKSCVRESGQIALDVNLADIEKVKDILTKISGIAFFSFAKRCKLDIETIKSESINFLKDEKFENFKIDAKRRDKNFKLNSVEINTIVGTAIVEKYGKSAKMKNPDVTLKIEISNKFAYISFADIKGVGGMPIKSKQRVVALLSGGFDSPVAAHLMMKRGCEVILVHFQNKNQVTKSVEGKIKKIAEQLSKFQIKTKLYIIPFESIQKEIIVHAQANMRMLVYRKFMIKISSKIADIERARFLVVGDSLSQVASQTLPNLEATYKNSDKHIFSPLIGFDKKEIIKISEEIGTFEICKLPYEDCCSYFLPKHPELRANAMALQKIDEKIDSALIEDSIKKAKIIEW